MISLEIIITNANCIYFGREEIETASESLEIQSYSTASTFTNSEKDQSIYDSKNTAKTADMLTSSSGKMTMTKIKNKPYINKRIFILF